MRIRVGLWLIIVGLAAPLVVAAVSGEWEITMGLAGILGTLASKLVESEEASR